MIGHWLNRTLQVWRPATTPDGTGGQTVTWAQSGTVAAKVDQPSTSERMLAQQAGSEHTHNIYLHPAAVPAVRRGDELRDPGTGEAWRITSVVHPSTARYHKASGVLIQSEGEPDG